MGPLREFILIFSGFTQMVLGVNQVKLIYREFYQTSQEYLVVMELGQIHLIRQELSFIIHTTLFLLQ